MMLTLEIVFLMTMLLILDLLLVVSLETESSFQDPMKCLTRAMIVT